MRNATAFFFPSQWLGVEELLQPRYPQRPKKKKKGSIRLTQQRDSSIYTHTSCLYTVFVNVFSAVFSSNNLHQQIGATYNLQICIHRAPNTKPRYITLPPTKPIDHNLPHPYLTPSLHNPIRPHPIPIPPTNNTHAYKHKNYLHSPLTPTHPPPNKAQPLLYRVPTPRTDGPAQLPIFTSMSYELIDPQSRLVTGKNQR